MPYGFKKNIILLAVLGNILKPANVQIAMPMYMPAAVPQPVYAVPAPMPIAVAIQMPVRKTSTTTTTTTTSEPPHYAIAVPVPVPMPLPLQFAIPAQPPPFFCQGKPKPKACPPCPPCVCLPSCTPAFFSYCSPCHQKCRCRNPEDAPVPLLPNPPVPVPGAVYPAPMPVISAPIVPSPVVVVPLPPTIRRPAVKSSSDSCGTDDSSDSSTDSDEFRGRRKLRRKIKRRKRKYRRNEGDESEWSDDLVKPILSYVSENGDVKFKTKLRNKDAIKILSKGRIKTSNEKPTLDIETDDSVVVTKGSRNSRRYNKVMLRDSPTNHELEKGKSKFIFKPPPDKKVNKVAVLFNVS